MQIFINGKKEEIEDDMSISKLIKAKKIRPEVVAVEVNDKIVEKDKYSEIVLKPEDRLEFVYYMGGGEENAK